MLHQELLKILPSLQEINAGFYRGESIFKFKNLTWRSLC